MGTSFHLVTSSAKVKNQKDTKMNPKILLISALLCLYAAPSLATFPLIFASNAANTGLRGIFAGSIPAGTTNVGQTTTIAGGAVLLGALGLTIGKALLLRRIMGVRGRIGVYAGRGKREAIPEISDEEATAYIMELLQEYQD